MFFSVYGHTLNGKQHKDVAWQYDPMTLDDLYIRKNIKLEMVDANTTEIPPKHNTEHRNRTDNG